MKPCKDCVCGMTDFEISRCEGAAKEQKRCYSPRTGERCACKPGAHRDNCPDCEGTGWRIDYAAIRARK